MHDAQALISSRKAFARTWQRTSVTKTECNQLCRMETSAKPLSPVGWTDRHGLIDRPLSGDHKTFASPMMARGALANA